MKRTKVFFAIALVLFIYGCAGLAFVTDRDGKYQIYKMSDSGKYQQNVSRNDFSDNFPDVSPDGQAIAFSSVRLFGIENIFIMEIDGDNLRRLTSGLNRKIRPRWSPSHDKIAYAECIDSNRAIIYSIPADGSGTPLQLTDPEPTQSDSGGHDFFYFGLKLVFSRYDSATGSYDLHWTAALYPVSPITITSTDDLDETLPVVSHNGEMLAFRASVEIALGHGKYTADMIQIMEVGTWEVIATFRPRDPMRDGTIAAIDFSPDDKSLYVAAEATDQSSGTVEVFRVSFEGDVLDRLTVNTAEDIWPSSIPKRWVKMSPYGDPKQGDRVLLKVEAGDRQHIQKVEYAMHRQTDQADGVVYSVPSDVSFNTCKSSGTYHTELEVGCIATYEDGERFRYQGSYDLTVGRTSREDSDRTYAFYVAEDSDSDLEDRWVSRANAFIDNFDSYSLEQYYWAETDHFTNGAINYANSVDLALALGHGSPYIFDTGNGVVNFTNTAFGSFVPCYDIGDLEYLVLASCDTLSVDDESFWDYWRHTYSTRLENRPFSGLHQVLGFRTTLTFSYWWLDDDGEDFFKEFSHHLDVGFSVREAWHTAAEDELGFDDGHNKSAVLYLQRYENDKITSNKDDYIYGNENYTFFIEYFE